MIARIGRQVPHFEEIDVDSIKAVFSLDKTHRYTLELSFRNSLLDVERSKTIAVILKNPSSADERKSDATIRKVETYVYTHFKDVRKLMILNLFGLRATDASDVQKLLLERNVECVIGENDKYVRAIVQSSDYVICAWGGNSGIDKKAYEARIEDIKGILMQEKKTFVYNVVGRKVTKQPLHGLMWGYDYKLENFEM